MKKKIVIASLACACIASNPMLCFAEMSEYADEIARAIPKCSDLELEALITVMQDELENRQESDENGDVADDKSWVLKYYVDEFDQPTESAYITYSDLLVGTFSNSATSDSSLYAKMLIDQSIAIMLYEYGNSQVTSYSDTDYNIIMRDSSGNKTPIAGTMYENGDRIFIDSLYQDVVLDTLSSGDEISFYVEESEHPITNYLFTIPETLGFNELYGSVDWTIPLTQ